MALSNSEILRKFDIDFVLLTKFVYIIGRTPALAEKINVLSIWGVSFCIFRVPRNPNIKIRHRLVALGQVPAGGQTQ